MPAIKVGTGDLLEYNSEYKLLICRQCQYAIQKSALESHLLRHKIYRGDRQKLLASIVRLDLLDPHRVPLPPPGSPAINGLPILSGFRCESPDCSHLTVSSKRMKRHWSESHDLDGSVPLSASLAQPVSLQTFFRGTKVKYFEVVPTTKQRSSPDDYQNDDDEDDQDWSVEEASSSTAQVTTAATKFPPPQRRIQTSVKPPDQILPNSFNLDTLNYFYHFINTTSTTLPNVRGSYSKHYWQTQVVTRALRRHWLMCGLLAISAYHMAVLAEDTKNRQTHREQGSQFSSGFDAGLVQTTGRGSNLEDTETEGEIKQTGEQIKSLLQCAQWTSNEVQLDARLEPLTPASLLSIMSAIRGSCAPDFVQRDASGRAYHEGPERQEDSYIQSWLQTGTPTRENVRGNLASENTPKLLAERLDALPNRIAERLGRTDNVQDVLTTLSAIKSLVHCCDVSFTCEETGAAWHGMVMWLVDISEYFHQMVSRHHPAALVVLAHWAAILVKRAECVDCWFLKGVAKNIVVQVVSQLSTNCRAVLDLVEWLEDLANG